mgnify:CR=1 FL=1
MVEHGPIVTCYARLSGTFVTMCRHHPAGVSSLRVLYPEHRALRSSSDQPALIARAIYLDLVRYFGIVVLTAPV